MYSSLQRLNELARKIEEATVDINNNMDAANNGDTTAQVVVINREFEREDYIHASDEIKEALKDIIQYLEENVDGADDVIGDAMATLKALSDRSAY
jgi:hypothetical protein